MNRRTILAGVGAPLCASVSGCLGVNSSLAEHKEQDNYDNFEIPDSASDYPRNSGDLEEFNPETTFKEVAVGDREGVDDSFQPHIVEIWNSSSDQDIEFVVINITEGEIKHANGYDVPGNSALSISLLKPAEYLVDVKVPQYNTSHTLQVPCFYFDCNTSATQIGVFESGQMSSVVISQTAACPSAKC